MLKYGWIDYTPRFDYLIESWFDKEGKKYTGCDDGFADYFKYWIGQPKIKYNENFWAKIILNENVPVGIIVLSSDEETYYIAEYIISPAERGRGVGSSALRELLDNGDLIIGKTIHKACACIFPDNTVSKKAFEKAGFKYSHTHADGDAEYYLYSRPYYASLL